MGARRRGGRVVRPHQGDLQRLAAADHEVVGDRVVGRALSETRVVVDKEIPRVTAQLERIVQRHPSPTFTIGRPAGHTGHILPRAHQGRLDQGRRRHQGIAGIGGARGIETVHKVFPHQSRGTRHARSRHAGTAR